MRVFNRVIGLLLFFIIIAIVAASGVIAEHSGVVNIEYYYYARCVSCDEGENIRKSVMSRMQRDFPETYIELNTYNTSDEENLKKLEQEFEKRGIDKERLLVQPVVFVGQRYLSGALEIADELSNAVQDFLSESGVTDENAIEEIKDKDIETPVKTAEIQKEVIEAPETKEVEENKHIKEIIYLYSRGCSECDKTESYIESVKSIEGENGEKYALSISRLDAGDIKKLGEVNAIYDKYNVPEGKRSVPMVICNGVYLVGYNDISDNLTRILKSEQTYTANTIKAAENIGNNISEQPDVKKEKKDFKNKIMLALISGIVSGFSPCSLSLLLLLVSLLIVDRKKIICGGCGFLLGRIVAYFLMGTVFYELMRGIEPELIISLRKTVLIMMIMLCAIFFCFYLTDFVLILKGKSGKTILKLPPGLKAFYENKIVQASKKNKLFLATMLIGILVAVGEFMCTGQVFAANVLYSFGDSRVAYSIFGIYSVAMLLPSVAVMWLVCIGKSYVDIACYTAKHEGMIKILMAIVFMCFAIIGIANV